MTRDMLYHPEDKNVFIEKWGKIIAKGDPYFNPNLSLKSYIPIPEIKELENRSQGKSKLSA